MTRAEHAPRHCEGWRKNASLIYGAVFFSWHHVGFSKEKPDAFVYCPWCGKKLDRDKGGD